MCIKITLVVQRPQFEAFPLTNAGNTTRRTAQHQTQAHTAELVHRGNSATDSTLSYIAATVAFDTEF